MRTKDIEGNVVWYLSLFKDSVRFWHESEFPVLMVVVVVDCAECGQDSNRAGNSEGLRVLVLSDLRCAKSSTIKRGVLRPARVRRVP